MLRAGQKVVYIGEEGVWGMRTPKKNQVVELNRYYGFIDGFHHWVISGYEHHPSGGMQIFHEPILKPIEESFAEEVEKMINEWVNEEKLIEV